MAMLYKKKVYAYITREKEGVMQLLVFTHRDVPKERIQIPGGIVRPEESLEAAILRKVMEETGLRHLYIERFIDDYIIYVKERQEYEKHHFFHMSLLTKVKDTWEHIVTKENQSATFCYEWVDIERGPALTGKQGEFIYRLLEGMYVK
ncbi:NUDIX domain-containing protein [Bacillus cytotoxicus]|uniref:NUDIX hydrolase n=1 Tax=Bacillus cytotoxicus TaxID=580165 RepID=A0AAX2CFU6_9BACI|nr:MULTISPECIES: NUDIX domain-containing protein [Bacillus cereus group]QTR77755.1 NUDIX domain-containing protein [Bacillus cytotoxicus]QTR82426.1 NUDIX domain-containing protein [Bacillus cytotoxicus]QTR86164.1 NUDIX domain-containing protein [Bacillus cytotoxicus]SCL90636.1 NUDIX hydrolase [Bacillus cytotoxicus]HDR4571484.1 NUDIX domain-containing protein [Bacillus cytotoxicus]